jgi:hypothetical protein
MRVCTILTLAILSTAWINSAEAHDMESMTAAKEDGNQKRNQWFNGLTSSGGGHCCSNDDGHHIAEKYTRNVDGHWFVFLEDDQVWAPVPDDHVVRTPSIDGEPYLFRTDKMGQNYSPGYPVVGSHIPLPSSPYGIRCFVPPVATY